ncbi:MAG: hypothetical protein M3Q29_07350 [Chloroflexota bacterium]|nr:hypothetical protein [Chloroflexota bacterium]
MSKTRKRIPYYTTHDEESDRRRSRGARRGQPRPIVGKGRRDKTAGAPRRRDWFPDESETEGWEHMMPRD